MASTIPKSQEFLSFSPENFSISIPRATSKSAILSGVSQRGCFSRKNFKDIELNDRSELKNFKQWDSKTIFPLLRGYETHTLKRFKTENSSWFDQMKQENQFELDPTSQVVVCSGNDLQTLAIGPYFMKCNEFLIHRNEGVIFIENRLSGRSLRHPKEKFAEMRFRQLMTTADETHTINSRREEIIDQSKYFCAVYHVDLSRQTAELSRSVAIPKEKVGEGGEKKTPSGPSAGLTVANGVAPSSSATSSSTDKEKFSLVYAWRIDCLDNKNYIPLKTKPKMAFYQRIAKFDLLKWNFQLRSMDADRIVCGYTNDQGVITATQNFYLSDLADEYWRHGWTNVFRENCPSQNRQPGQMKETLQTSENACLNFLYDLLRFINKNVREGEQHVLSWDSAESMPRHNVEVHLQKLGYCALKSFNGY